MREKDNLEFKESISNTFLKTVSAYANYGTGIRRIQEAYENSITKPKFEIDR